MLPRDRKISEGRPCLFLEWDERKKRWEPTPPIVDCSYRCDSCGWNEAEQKRRLEEGRWVDDGRGVKYLLFKPKQVHV